MRQLLNGLVTCAALGALLAWCGHGEAAFVGTPDPRLDRSVAMGEWAQNSIDVQLAALGCDKTRRLTDLVAVRNAATDKAGHIQFDTTTVRTEPLEQGFVDAAAGKVWVVGWCG